MTDVPLTKGQAEMRLIIARFQRKYGYAPSIRELASKSGKSKTQVHRYMDGLVRRGAAEKVAGSARGFRLL